jgi:putative endonuclease
LAETVAFYVYILTNKQNGTLYAGMTDDLVRRTWQHRTGAMPGFTQKYGVKTLVWYERHDTRESAFMRERQIKKWNRAWKLNLIESTNPDWRDLWDEINR